MQALETTTLPLATRIFASLVRAATPDGATPLHLRLVLGRRRAANRAAAERLIGLDPARVIFAHGAWFACDGQARLRRALTWLLD